MVRTEEEVLRLVSNAYEAQQHSTSKWSINYWTIVLRRLQVRYPYYGRYESN